MSRILSLIDALLSVMTFVTIGLAILLATGVLKKLTGNVSREEFVDYASIAAGTLLIARTVFQIFTRDENFLKDNYNYYTVAFYFLCAGAFFLTAVGGFSALNLVIIGIMSLSATFLLRFFRTGN